MFSRSKAWAVALLATVFLAGGAAGWVVGSRSARPFPRMGRGPDGMAEYLARRLDLSANQRDSVQAGLARHHAEMQAIWRTVRPRLDSLRAVVNEEIRVQLTPVQQERYTRLLAELEHQHERHRHRDSTTTRRGQH
jgi:hypothetical protein